MLIEIHSLAMGVWQMPFMGIMVYVIQMRPEVLRAKNRLISVIRLSRNYKAYKKRKLNLYCFWCLCYAGSYLAYLETKHGNRSNNILHNIDAAVIFDQHTKKEPLSFCRYRGHHEATFKLVCSCFVMLFGSY